jgi:ribonuclease P protein component
VPPRRRGPLWVRHLDDGALPPRVAYSIGTAFGHAPARNRFRRRLRAAMRELGEGLRPGTYLVGARPGAATMSHDELLAALRALVTTERAERE